MRLVSVVRILAAVIVVMVAVFAGGALERRGVVQGVRGPAGPSSGENASGPAEREIQAAREALPPAGESLSALPGTLTDASGRARRLAEFAGTPYLASLIYTRCPTVCPLVIGELKQIERLEQEGQGMRFVLFTLDPAHDTPGVLRAFAEAHALDPARWTLLAPDPVALAAVAHALGVASAPETGGAIAHSAVIAVVDREGRVRRRHVGPGSSAESLAAELRAAR